MKHNFKEIQALKFSLVIVCTRLSTYVLNLYKWIYFLYITSSGDAETHPQQLNINMFNTNGKQQRDDRKEVGDE